jgi:NAD-dependent deacetylase
MSKVVILSGAGISAESGISTFREKDGLWDNHDVSIVCNYDSMQKHEEVTVAFYDNLRIKLKDKEPNAAHKAIAELKAMYKDDIAVITQNIDNLFEKAGIEHEDVIHLHGFTTELRCQNDYCDFTKDIGYIAQNEFNSGICPMCDSKLRPNIVFFGEAAPLYTSLNQELHDCELFVVIGTSGNVINTDALVGYVKYSILNNLEPSIAINDELYSKVFYQKATEAIDEIAYEIEEFLK